MHSSTVNFRSSWSGLCYRLWQGCFSQFTSYLIPHNWYAAANKATGCSHKVHGWDACHVSCMYGRWLRWCFNCFNIHEPKFQHVVSDGKYSCSPLCLIFVGCLCLWIRSTCNKDFLNEGDSDFQAGKILSGQVRLCNKKPWDAHNASAASQFCAWNSRTKRPLGNAASHESSGTPFHWRFVPPHMGSPSKSAVVLQAAF